MKNKHIFWMIIGCTLPLLLLFLAPALGLKGNWGLFGFVIAMFICHILLHGRHGATADRRDPTSGRSETPNHKNHGSH